MPSTIQMIISTLFRATGQQGTIYVSRVYNYDALERPTNVSHEYLPRPVPASIVLELHPTAEQRQNIRIRQEIIGTVIAWSSYLNEMVLNTGQMAINA